MSTASACGSIELAADAHVSAVLEPMIEARRAAKHQEREKVKQADNARKNEAEKERQKKKAEKVAGLQERSELEMQKKAYRGPNGATPASNKSVISAKQDAIGTKNKKGKAKVEADHKEDEQVDDKDFEPGLQVLKGWEGESHCSAEAGGS